MKLSGKAAIVTGAAQGIGKAIATKLASEGANVVLFDQAESKLYETVQDIRAKGGEATAIVGSVTNRTDVKRMVETTAGRYKGVHILVNNAGIVRAGLLKDMKEEDWDAIIAVDLKGVFNCIQAVAQRMMDQRYGKICNMASIAGTGHASPGMGAYGAAKGGVIQLTKVAARELGPYNVNVNAIAPGYVNTGIQVPGLSEQEARAHLEAIYKLAVLGRGGTPEDVADLTAFLVSEEARHITGQVITTDGGRADGI